VDVRDGVAEQLPWPDGHFDAALASLVLAFMQDPGQGVREMRRVTRQGGTVATCTWDIAGGGRTMLRLWMSAVDAVRPDLQAVGPLLAGSAQGDIARRFRDVGLVEVTEGQLTSHAAYPDFDDFWEPFTLAVGPAARVIAGLTDAERAAVRDECRAQLPQTGPFVLDARAWYAIGKVPHISGAM
jgi:SAM-dependent methyltransferase